MSFEISDSLDANSSQHLRDLKLAIEYKYLRQHAPGGTFLIPEIDDTRKFHGVIFIRRGLYRNGIFRFTIDIPLNYNSMGSYPTVIFNPPIFNPLVNQTTGELDLKVNTSQFAEWNPENCFLVTVLIFLKKIFYMKSYDTFERLPNEEARQLFGSDEGEFLQRVAHEVEESLRRIYDEKHQVGPIQFSEPKPAHDFIRDKILASCVNAGGNTAAGSSTVRTDSEDPDRGSSNTGDSDFMTPVSKLLRNRTNDREDSADLVRRFDISNLSLTPTPTSLA